MWGRYEIENNRQYLGYVLFGDGNDDGSLVQGFRNGVVRSVEVQKISDFCRGVGLGTLFEQCVSVERQVLLRLMQNANAELYDKMYEV